MEIFLTIYAVIGFIVALCLVLATRSEATPGEAGEMLKYFPLLVLTFALACALWPLFLLWVFLTGEED